MDVISSDIINEINENVNLMLSFAKKAGIEIDEIPNYCVTRNMLTYTTDKVGLKEEMDELHECVSISLDKKIDRVRIKKETRYSYGFIFSESNPDCQDYNITSHQVITEFLVKDGKLEVTTATVTQTIEENELFVTENIIDFNYVADFNRTRKLDSLPSNHNIKIETENYSIPEDYHITDGVDSIGNQSNVLVKTNE